MAIIITMTVTVTVTVTMAVAMAVTVPMAVTVTVPVAIVGAHEPGTVQHEHHAVGEKIFWYLHLIMSVVRFIPLKCIKSLCINYSK